MKTLASLGLLLLIAPGCALEPDVGTDLQAVTSTNALSLNALSLNALSLNALSLNALSLNALSADSFELADTELLETELGRDLLHYLAKCALDDKDRLEAEVDGVVYRFPGGLELAPDWLDKPLSDEKRRWVSACLLAHVNYYGVRVAISLRGHHNKLDRPKKSETKDFPIEEGAFFGDLFADEPML